MSISFDRVSDIYDATRGLPGSVSEQVTRCILDITSATAQTQFLEIGVGTGRIALPIVQQGYAYTGIDISENMMTALRQKLGESTHRLTLLQADATALPFANSSFDVALAVHVFHLIPNWQKAVAEVCRVLKQTGILLYTHGRAHAAKPGESNFDQGVFDFDQQWRSLLSHYGFEPTEYGATESEVMEYLHQQGATWETIIAAQWRIQQTVSDLLDRYRRRVYSSCWQIPADVFTPAIADLTEWCQSHYGSLDVALSHNMDFKITVVQHWSN